MKFSVIIDISMLLAIIYPYITWPTKSSIPVFLVERYHHDMRVIQVSLFKPPYSMVKLNTDGNALKNPRSIGVGRIIRNNMSNLVYV